MAVKWPDVCLSLPTSKNFVNLTGLTFSRLTAIGIVGKQWRNYVWKCECECGNITHVKSGELRSGGIKSCGCWKIEATKLTMTTHGHTAGNNRKASPAYSRWCDIKTRCTNHNRTYSHRYADRGIKMCDRWANSFESFLEDMGHPPEGMTIDRIDNERGYSKENCRWATMREQAANTSRNRRITISGESMIVMDASRRFGVSQYTIYNRLNRGLSDHEAVFGTGRSRYVTINGERMIVSEAEKRFNVSRGTIYSRLDRGLTDHEAVFGAQK